MIRKIITINESKCNGCGLCVTACHEGAIGLVLGKAKLLRDDYCDGLGNCLPACPTGAITFEEREALAFNESAVSKNTKSEKLPCDCAGTLSQSLHRIPSGNENQRIQSQLNQWPVQIKLVPVHAPYFAQANLLIAADCSAFAYGNFHADFIKNHITLIGCPKLDDGDYSEKLTEIMRLNTIKSVTVVRMSVPCCGGIEHAVKIALKNCEKSIPLSVVTLTTDGKTVKN